MRAISKTLFVFTVILTGFFLLTCANVPNVDPATVIA